MTETMEQAKNPSLPTKIVVSGTDFTCINGTYRCTTLRARKCSNIAYVLGDGAESYTIHAFQHLDEKWRWFIREIEDDKNFYRTVESLPGALVGLVPPMTGWEEDDDGSLPVPVLTFRFD
jgi:hypothetical protein